VRLEGYIGVDWFHESHTIVRVQRDRAGGGAGKGGGGGNTTSVQLGESSHYGVCEALQALGPKCTGGDSAGAPGRFRVHGQVLGDECA
jgi:hypothetical protein